MIDNSIRPIQTEQIVVPRVQHAQTVPQPAQSSHETNSDSLDYLLAQAIEIAKANFHPKYGMKVGVATVTDKKTGDPVPVNVFEYINGYVRKFTLAVGDGALGRIDLCVLKADQKTEFGIYGPTEIRPTKPMARYGNSKNKNLYLDKVYVKYCESPGNNRYKNIGKSMHQLSVETSFNTGCEGRVQLDASYSSHGFHYKNGMRVMHDDAEQIERAIAEGLKGAESGKEPMTDYLGSVEMYLPEDKIQEWVSVISKTPILTN